MKKNDQNAADLLNRTQFGVVSVAPTQAVFDVMQILSDQNIGAVIVLEQNKLVGILSERDCVRKLEIKGRSARETKVADIMTQDVVFAAPDWSVNQCRRVMGVYKIRHLPVVDRGHVIGVLSIRDVLEDVIREDTNLIQRLEADRLNLTTNTGTY